MQGGKEDGAPRKDCGEEGVSTSMTASCDVLMPPRRHKEASVVDGEKRVRMKCSVMQLGIVGAALRRHK